MRIAVTGASGFVAGHVLSQAPTGWTVEGWSREPENAHHWPWRQVDLLNFDALNGVIEAGKPDAIVHAAAIPNIDYCEAHPDEADLINARAPRELAERCAARGIRFVFVSTDNVFEGTGSMYAEDAARRPVNHYGWTKVAAEDAVLAAYPETAVARLPLVMGFPASSGGDSFLARMLPEWKAGRAVEVPGTEVRTPVDVVTAGRALLELAGNAFSGTIHVAGTERINRLDYVRTIAELMGFDGGLVTERAPASLPERAPRPLDVSLAATLARETLSTPMLGVAESVDLVRAASEELD